jgi:CHAT domain-containing protein
VHMRPATLMLAAGLLLSGCQTDGSKPVVSVEEARRITASFSGQTGFTPPPRRIDDITRILDTHRPDPAVVRALSDIADRPVPPGLAGSALVTLLLERSIAAGDLGRYDQQVADLRAAAGVTGVGTLQRSAVLSEMSSAELFAGNPVSALRAARDRLRELGPSGGSQIGASASEARILARLGDIEGANRSLERARRAMNDPNLARWPPYPMFLPAWQAALGRADAAILEATGRFGEAERAARDALGTVERIRANMPALRRETAEVPPNLPEIQELTSRMEIAKMLTRQGRLVEAEAEARGLLVWSLERTGRYSTKTANVILILSVILREQGRHAESARMADAGIDVLTTIGAGNGSRILAGAHMEKARSMALDGDWTGAAAAVDAAREVFPAGSAEREAFVGRDIVYGQVLLATGRGTEAVEVYRRILADRTQRLGARHYDTAEGRGLLAAALVGTGRPEEALPLFREAVPTLLAASRQAEADDGLAALDRRRQTILNAYLGLLASDADGRGAAASDAAAEAFRIADSVRARGVQRAIAESAARTAIPDPALADLVRREQDARKRIGALFGLLAEVQARPADQQDRDAALRLRTDVDRLRDARAAIRQEIEARFPDYVNLIDPRPATVEETRRLLRAGEGLLATYTTDDRTYVWLVRPDAPVRLHVATAGTREIGDLVARIRLSLEPRGDTLGTIPAYDLAAAARLHALLLAPLGDTTAGIESLLVVPDGALGQIPLGLLVTRPVPAPSDGGGALFSRYRSVPFLIRDTAVTQLPSVAALGTLRRARPASAARRAFAGFGDPLFSERQVAEARADGTLALRAAPSARDVRMQRRSAPETRSSVSADLAALPRLPDTADEVRSIAAALGADPAADVFLGPAANEQRVRTMDLSDRRVIVFATHGLVPGDLDGLTQPALALSAPQVAGVPGDGLLTLDEILGLRLDADWVVLSACNTAAADGGGAEAASGLGRAFFYADTRAVLLTNWPVETTSARLLTTDLFRRQAQDPGLGRAQAMRRAMLALIDGRGAEADGRVLFSYAHPIFWAPFTVVGDGG